MILIHDIRLPLSAGGAAGLRKASSARPHPRGKVSHLGIARLSVDARHGQPKLVYTVAVTLKEEKEEAACAGASRSVTVRGKTDLSVQNGTLPLTHRPWSRGPARRASLRRCCWPVEAIGPSCWNAARRWTSASRPWSISPPPVSWTKTPTSSSARAAPEPSRTVSSPPASATSSAAS